MTKTKLWKNRRQEKTNRWQVLEYTREELWNNYYPCVNSGNILSEKDNLYTKSDEQSETEK